jgi:aldose 1-epimerase
MTRVVLEEGRARVEVDLEAGCRLASLRVEGHELLVGEGPGPIEWGSYPMAPWAGRVRGGRFSFAGSDYALPINLGGHAIHGTVFVQPWTMESDGSFVTPLRPPWPFPGFVRQGIVLHSDALELRLEVHPEEGPMPAVCGWHPWFRREVGGSALLVTFRPGFMLERDTEGIPTGRRMVPPPGPWDDCFGDLQGPAVLDWPGVLRLTLESSCEYLVVFDQRSHAVCVEPQTAPPDALNGGATIVEPGHPLVAISTWRWESLVEGRSP